MICYFWESGLSGTTRLMGKGYIYSSQQIIGRRLPPMQIEARARPEDDAT